MNSGFWWSKQCMKSDESFWPHLEKDSKKQMLGTYDEFIRAKKKMKNIHKNFEDEEGGEQ